LLTCGALLSTRGFLLANLALKCLQKAAPANFRRALPKPDILPAERSRKALGPSRVALLPQAASPAAQGPHGRLLTEESAQTSPALPMMSTHGAHDVGRVLDPTHAQPRDEGLQACQQAPCQAKFLMRSKFDP